MNNGDAQTETLWKKVDAQGDFFDFWGVNESLLSRSYLKVDTLVITNVKFQAGLGSRSTSNFEFNF